MKTNLTTPPASDTIRAPAAISQQWIPSKSWFKYFLGFAMRIAKEHLEKAMI